MSPWRTGVRTKGRRGFVGVALGLLLAGGVLAAPWGHAQPRSAGEPTAVDGQRPVLLAVPEPTLEGLDEPVRRGLASARGELDATLSTPGLTGEEAARAYGDLGLMYQAHLILDPAEACYRNAMGLAPEDYRWPYYLGYLQEERGRLEEASQAYEAALRLAPGLATASLRLGQVELGRGRLERAEPLLRTAADVPEMQAAARFALGRLAYERHAYAQAVEDLEQALALSPEATRIHHALGLAYRGLGDLDRARDHLSRRGDRSPTFPDPLIDDLFTRSTGPRTLFRNAMYAVHRGQYEAAARSFRAGLSLEPENPDARVSLARALYLGGDRPGARLELEETLRRAPAHTLGGFLLGALCEESGDAGAAAARYRAVLEADPEHPGAHYYLGNLLMRGGEYGEAADHYALALRQAPENTYARVREVLALLQADAPHAELRDRLETAHAGDPSDPTVTYLLGALLAASPDPGVRDGARALAVASDLYAAGATPERAELLAMAYAEVGEFDQALALQGESLEMATALGRLDLVPRLTDNLSLFRDRQPCRRPWPPGGLAVGLPPVNAAAAFQGYPAESPY